jgi:tyrosinase
VPDRKNAFKISKTEQDAYIDGVTKMIADGTYKKLVDIHSDMSHNMHTMGGPKLTESRRRFLSWHRAYLIHMEEELRKKNNSAFIPYWKWVDGGVPDWLKVFMPKVGSVENKRNNSIGAVAVQQRIDDLLVLTDYDTFTSELERNPHNKGHVALGYPMESVPVAPSDPIFWMHHGEVDRVWSLWQAKNPGKKPILTGTDAIMDPWSDTVDSLDDIGKLGYKYV